METTSSHAGCQSGGCGYDCPNWAECHGSNK